VKPNRRSAFLAVLAAVVAMVAGMAPAHADVRVGGMAFFANGQLARNFQYTGSCPVVLKFDFGVIGTEAAQVTYTFVRSDGGHLAGPRTLILPAANRSMPVLEEWQLGANTPAFSTYQGWVRLDILSPNAASQRIAFTLHCG